MWTGERCCKCSGMLSTDDTCCLALGRLYHRYCFNCLICSKSVVPYFIHALILSQLEIGFYQIDFCISTGAGVANVYSHSTHIHILYKQWNQEITLPWWYLSCWWVVYGFVHSALYSYTVQDIDVKKTFTFFYFGHAFLRFLTFFLFSKRFFYLKKALAKFRAASRLTRSSFKITEDFTASLKRRQFLQN